MVPCYSNSLSLFCRPLPVFSGGFSPDCKHVLGSGVWCPTFILKLFKSNKLNIQTNWMQWMSDSVAPFLEHILCDAYICEWFTTRDGLTKWVAIAGCMLYVCASVVSFILFINCWVAGNIQWLDLFLRQCWTTNDCRSSISSNAPSI